MARPVKTRTADTLRRDVESLTRLRSALMLDKSLDAARVKETVGLIDSLTNKLVDLIHAPRPAP